MVALIASLKETFGAPEGATTAAVYQKMATFCGRF
jgi:hypothetical protein